MCCWQTLRDPADSYSDDAAEGVSRKARGLWSAPVYASDHYEESEQQIQRGMLCTCLDV